MIRLFLLSERQMARISPYFPLSHGIPRVDDQRVVDVELIDSAKHEIDFAAYVLTDWPVMQALKRAADRGVKVRIYLDGAQFAEREPTKVFEDLAHSRGVEIRVKRENSALMHLKSYEIDGHLLRTGAANFSASGLKRRDNDLIVLRDAQAAAKFKHAFDARFASGEAIAPDARFASGEAIAPDARQNKLP